jgi:hypothetical protein
MGALVSVLTEENFPSGKYWIGKSVETTRKALRNHYPDKQIFLVSHSELYSVEDKEHDYNRLVVVYNPDTYKTVNIIQG